MWGPALGEYNAASHLVWTVIYILLVLVPVLLVADYLRILCYRLRNRRLGYDGYDGPPTSVDPTKGEGVQLQEPDTMLRRRYFHRIVPVWRTWFEGRFQDPLRSDRPER